MSDNRAGWQVLEMSRPHHSAVVVLAAPAAVFVARGVGKGEVVVGGSSLDLILWLDSDSWF